MWEEGEEGEGGLTSSSSSSCCLRKAWFSSSSTDGRACTTIMTHNHGHPGGQTESEPVGLLEAGAEEHSIAI